MAYDLSPINAEFPVELAFWEANQEALNRDHPAKWILIRGAEIYKVLDDDDQLEEAFRTEYDAHPFLARGTVGLDVEPVLIPSMVVEGDR